jgi:hypothetical protein
LREEISIFELNWAFWQYFLESECALVPDADAPLADLVGFVGEVVGLTGSSDDNVLPYASALYQSGTETGYPDFSELEVPLQDLLRYPGSNTPRTFVPADIPMEFDPFAMADIDRWVKERGTRLIFIYGQNDPWSAEPFELGPGTTDSYRYIAPGANHRANISRLRDEDKFEAANAIRTWAGLEPFAPPPAPSARSIGAANSPPRLQPTQSVLDVIVAMLRSASEETDRREQRPLF